MENTKEKLQLDKLAELSKALGHPHRIRIIKILAELQEDGRCQQCMVGNIVDQLPIAQSTVSQHLKVLKDSGWIEGRINGPRVCYCLRKNIFKKYKDLIDKIR